MRKLLSPILLTVIASGCVSLHPQPTPLREAIFKGSIQQIWLAAEKVLANYPIAESNIDAGILKTDYLRGPSCWTAPGTAELYSSGVRCNLAFHFVPIPGSGTRVRVTKTVEMVRDFVAEPEVITSDGLEEMAVLYRIDRELTIAREVAKQNKQ